MRGTGALERLRRPQQRGRAGNVGVGDTTGDAVEGGRDKSNVGTRDSTTGAPAGGAPDRPRGARTPRARSLVRWSRS